MKSLYLFLAFIVMTGIFIPSCKKDASKPKSPTKIIDSLNLFKGDSTAFTPGEIVVKTTGDTIVVSARVYRHHCATTGDRYNRENDLAGQRS